MPKISVFIVNRFYFSPLGDGGLEFLWLYQYIAEVAENKNCDDE